MRNPFRRRPEPLTLPAELESFVVPDDPAERLRLMELYQDDPSPLAGHKFWRLAFPDIEAGFWAARREIHTQNGWTQ